MITGFRVARGGAQELSACGPTSSRFGKVIGGGLPVGAFGGRADVMASLAPLGPVYQAGTLSGNPLATAAGLAALDLLDDAAYAQLDATRATRLARRAPAGLRRRRASPSGVDPGGTLVGLFFGADAARRLRERPAHRRGAPTPRSSTRCSTAGVALAPGAYEVLFPGLAHTDDVIDEVVDAAAAAARAVA